MKNDELKNVRGSIDFGGNDAKIRNFISSALRATFEEYGYSPLETSILCYYDLLALKYDEDNDILKEIYKVSDQGNRNLALRYDLTVPFAKYIATNPNIKLPYKRYEIGKVFRDGPIKKGRVREFIQCDVDSVGIEGQMVEAELVSIFVEGYKKLGIDVVIKYNNRKLMNGIIECCNIPYEKVSSVITIIDKIEKLTAEELREEFYKLELNDEQIDTLTNFLKLDFFKLKNQLKNLQNKKNQNENLQEGISELEELTTYIEELGYSKYTKFSAALARGQEYYTGTIFEVYVADGSISSSIGGGGRYDNMIGDFINDGKKYPAVGISFGLDVIYELLKGRQSCMSSADVYVIPMGNNIMALKIANRLRAQNVKVDINMNNNKLKKALNMVDDNNIPLAIILGESELADNKIVVKDMRNGLQLVADIEEIENTVNELLTMGYINYKVLNPGGNKTALVDGNEYSNNQKKLINNMIMSKNPDVEQVGFLSKKEKRLEMAGGEFCMNATRCATWEYLKGEKGEIELTVSGTDKKICGRILENKKVQVELEIEKSLKELFETKGEFCCIKLDGILIAVLNEEKSKEYIKILNNNENEAKNKIKELMKDKLNTKEAAVGVILIEKNGGKIKINPIVWVKEIDTVFYETACGSGSLGVAVYNYLNNEEKSIDLVQPSGYDINIELICEDKIIKKALVSGIVI